MALDFTAEIFTASGWLVLDDVEGGYETEAASVSERAVSYRQRTVAGDWVEGTYVVSSVRENVAEQLHVYVAGADESQLDERVTRLTDALEQLRYQVRVRAGGVTEVWTCMPAAYSVVTPREYRHATIAMVRAEVPRLPTMEVTRA